MTHILDTHALVWFLEASPRLSARACTAISNTTSQLVIPSIVLVEITFLYARKRIATNIGEIHDAIVVATALVYRDVLRQEVTVITKDEAIRQSGLVEVLW